MFWMNIITAATTLAVVWTPPGQAFFYNAMLNLVGSMTGQAAQTLIAGVALKIAPRSMGASFLAVISTMVGFMNLLALEVSRVIATTENSFNLSFITGAAIIASGCLAIPFLGKAALPTGGEEEEMLEAAAAGVHKASTDAVRAANPLQPALAAATAADANVELRPDAGAHDVVRVISDAPPELPGAADAVGEWGAKK